MAVARPLPLTSTFLSSCSVQPHRCIRQLHHQVSASNVPPPIPFVPDSKTFLTLIGRNLIQHAAKIPTWDSLFSLTSAQLREVGVEPARNRRYLLWWRDRFKKGIYGIGGDLRHVADATANLRVVEVPYENVSSRVSRTGLEPKRKLVVDIPPEMPIAKKELKSIKGYKVVGAYRIAGPYIKAVKGTSGSAATIQVQEGMWEEKRGVKIDGGERRRAQVRHKKRIEENRKKSR